MSEKTETFRQKVLAEAKKKGRKWIFSGTYTVPPISGDLDDMPDVVRVDYYVLADESIFRRERQYTWDDEWLATRLEIYPPGEWDLMYASSGWAARSGTFVPHLLPHQR